MLQSSQVKKCKTFTLGISPEMKKSLKRTDKIESEMNYILFRHKDKKCGDFLFQTKDIERKMKKLHKKIDHSENEIIKHNICHSKTMKEKEELQTNQQQKKNINKYLGNETEVIKREIEEMRKKIAALNTEKVQMECKVVQWKEEMKYLSKDEKEAEAKVQKIKKERDELFNLVNIEKEKIFKITNGAKVSEDFVRKVTRLIKSK